MVQSRVIVSYAPTQRTAGNTPVPVKRSERRWGVTLAGVLLAGGAVCALGQFAAPDGSLREAGIPVLLGPPQVDVERATPRTSSPLPDATGLETPPSTLPYLALVHEVAPTDTPVAKRQAQSGAAPKQVPRVTGRIAMPDTLAPNAPVDDSPADASVAHHPATDPVGENCGDLEALLGEQRTVCPALAFSDDNFAPVETWTPDDIAIADGIEPPPAKAALAPAAGIALVPNYPGLGDALILTGSDPSEILAEVPGATAPDLIASARDAALSMPAPIDEGSAQAGSIERTTPGYRDKQMDQAIRLALAPSPASPGPGEAAAAATPAATYTQHFPLAVVNGEPLGAITLRDLDTEGLAIHLGALLGLLKLRMADAEFARLSAAATADQFVTLDRLRAAGITIQFDAKRDRLLIDAR